MATTWNQKTDLNDHQVVPPDPWFLYTISIGPSVCKESRAVALLQSTCPAAHGQKGPVWPGGAALVIAGNALWSAVLARHASRLN